VFDRVIRDQRILSAAQQLLDDDVYVHQSRFNYQPPFQGTGFYWHSDFETWHAEDGMPTPRCLSAVIMLNSNKPQNGCVMIMPGSHREYVPCAGRTPDKNWTESLQAQVAGTPSESALMELSEKFGIEYMTGEAGDVLLFDSNAMHGSHSNVSPWARSNAFVVYNAVSNQVTDPYAAACPRPLHVATREPEYMRPLVPASGSTIEEMAEKDKMTLLTM